MHRSIKVNVIKENSSKVTIKLLSLNRKMIVPKDKFIERVESGEYEVMNGYKVEGQDKEAVS